MNVIRKHQLQQQQQQTGVSPSVAEIQTQNQINNNANVTELNKLIDLQKQEMRRLRGQIVDLETKISERPLSGNRLPPLQQVSM